jgi:adhesin/invasin
VGCKKAEATDPSPVPTSLVVVQGANQTIQAGKELPNPVVLRVTDASGAPMPGIPVSFIVSAGGGSVNPGTVTSDKSGEAKTKWTLGPSETAQRIDASSPGLDPVTIKATALVPVDIVVVQGANQSARVNSPLPYSLVIRVVGAQNVPMVGIPVAFQIAGGGGVITPQSAVTNATGEVTAKWTMGSIAGANTLAVVVGALPATLVAATAMP